jgi:O-antigen ligase
MVSLLSNFIYEFKWSGRLAQILFCLLFAYISLVPYYYLQEQGLTEDVPQFSFAKYGPFALVCFVAFFWTLEWSCKKRIWIRTSIDPFLVASLIVSLCSLIGAEYARVGLAKWLYYHTTGGMLCLLLLQYCTSWKVIKTIASVLCLVSGMVVLYAFVVSFLDSDPIWGATQSVFNPYYTKHRATGPFGHTVATASYTMLFFPLAIWYFLCLKNAKHKILWALVCLLFLPVILLTQTRGTQIATVLCCLMMAPWLKGLGSIRVPTRRWAIGLAIACALLVFAIWKSGFPDLIDERLAMVGQRWQELQGSNPITNKKENREYHYGSMLEYAERFRIVQYKEVARHLVDQPFLGVGFGVYTRIFEKGKYEYTNDEIWGINAHTTENMYLLFLVETGWIGLLVRLLLQGAVLLAIIRGYRRKVCGQQRNLLLAILAGQSALMLNMLTWDILNEPTMRMAFWMLTGLALATVRCEQSKAIEEQSDEPNKRSRLDGWRGMQDQ